MAGDLVDRSRERKRVYLKEEAAGSGRSCLDHQRTTPLHAGVTSSAVRGGFAPGRPALAVTSRVSVARAAPEPRSPSVPAHGDYRGCMRHFSRAGLHFDVRDEGPENGPAVLLLHGFPQDATAWDQIVTPLHDRGYRTLAPDLRGYSPGARPAGRRAYQRVELQRDSLALLDAAEVEHAHVVGHDFGGLLAWDLGANAPARVRSVTSLSTPHPAAMAWAVRHGDQALRSWYMLMIQLPRLPEYLLRPGTVAWQALTRGLPRHQAQHYAERMRQPGALTAALSWYRALPRDLKHPSTPVRRVHTPTLYLWGQRDPALGRDAAEATARYVAGPYRFVELPGVGHWLPETAAGQVTDGLLSFWDSLD